MFVARWIGWPEVQAFQIMWFHSLIPTTGKQTAGQHLKALRPATWNYIPACVCCKVDLRAPSPGLPNHMISIVSSPQQGGELLGRVWKHWGTPQGTASWYVLAARSIWGPQAQTLQIMWFLQSLLSHKEVNFWLGCENTETLQELYPGMCLLTGRTEDPKSRVMRLSQPPPPHRGVKCWTGSISIETRKQTD
jgi:hypothetical protein